MTLIAANRFLMELKNGTDKPFKPQQILAAFELQLARRERFERQDICFLPPPSVEEAKSIVAESKGAITSILAGHNLSTDAEVEDTAVREELVQVVREHLKKFAY